MADNSNQKVQSQADYVFQIRPKNPHVAAILGLLFGPIAYLYIWKITRGIIFLGINLMITYVLSSAATFQQLAGTIVISVIISYDCWRITKVENENIMILKQKVQVQSQQKFDMTCTKCKFPLAISYQKCPNCGTNLIQKTI